MFLAALLCAQFGGSGAFFAWPSGGCYSERKVMSLTLEIERKVDGRWLAEVLELPGAMAYGDSRAAAVAAAKAAALRALADQIEHGELPSRTLDAVRFEEREPVAL